MLDYLQHFEGLASAEAARSAIRRTLEGSPEQAARLRLVVQSASDYAAFVRMMAAKAAALRAERSEARQNGGDAPEGEACAAGCFPSDDDARW